MPSWIKNSLQFLLGVVLAAVLLYFTYKDTNLNELMNTLREADLFWFGLNGVLLLLSFFIRAFRWQILIKSAGYNVRSGSIIIAVMVSYLVNTATPRLGEIARCSALYRTDKVPIATGFGTVFIERVIDLLVLLLGVGLIFIFELERLLALWQKTRDASAGGGGESNLMWALVILGLLATGGIVGLIWLLLTRVETGIIARARNFVKQMIDGDKSIFQLQRPGLFLLLTALLWIDLVMMFYAILESLPGSEGMGVYYAILLLFIGGIGWALPVPGGMGSTHFIVKNLFLVFGYSAILGEAIGALSNGATTIFTVAMGMIAVIIFFLIKPVEGSSSRQKPPLSQDT